MSEITFDPRQFILDDRQVEAGSQDEYRTLKRAAESQLDRLLSEIADLMEAGQFADDDDERSEIRSMIVKLQRQTDAIVKEWNL